MTAAAVDALAAVQALGGEVTLASPGRLRVVAPAPLPNDLVERLRAAKPELLTLLKTRSADSCTGAQEERAAIIQHVGGAELVPGAGRLVSIAEDEPRLEQQCANRRGRVQALDDGAFLHFCCRCGRFASFGYGVRLRAGRLGRWYCGEHRPQAHPF